MSQKLTRFGSHLQWSIVPDVDSANQPRAYRWHRSAWSRQPCGRVASYPCVSGRERRFGYFCRANKSEKTRSRLKVAQRSEWVRHCNCLHVINVIFESSFDMSRNKSCLRELLKLEGQGPLNLRRSWLELGRQQGAGTEWTSCCRLRNIAAGITSRLKLNSRRRWIVSDWINSQTSQDFFLNLKDEQRQQEHWLKENRNSSTHMSRRHNEFLFITPRFIVLTRAGEDRPSAYHICIMI